MEPGDLGVFVARAVAGGRVVYYRDAVFCIPWEWTDHRRRAQREWEMRRIDALRASGVVGELMVKMGEELAARGYAFSYEALGEPLGEGKYGVALDGARAEVDMNFSRLRDNDEVLVRATRRLCYALGALDLGRRLAAVGLRPSAWEDEDGAEGGVVVGGVRVCYAGLVLGDRLAALAEQ